MNTWGRLLCQAAKNNLEISLLKSTLAFLHTWYQTELCSPCLPPVLLQSLHIKTLLTFSTKAEKDSKYLILMQLEKLSKGGLECTSSSIVASDLHISNAAPSRPSVCQLLNSVAWCNAGRKRWELQNCQLDVNRLSNAEKIRTTLAFSKDLIRCRMGAIKHCNHKGQELANVSSPA